MQSLAYFECLQSPNFLIVASNSTKIVPLLLNEQTVECKAIKDWRSCWEYKTA